MPQRHLSFEFGAHYICNTIPLNEDFIIQVCLDDAFALIRNFHLNYQYMYCCRYYQIIFIPLPCIDISNLLRQVIGPYMKDLKGVYY